MGKLFFGSSPFWGEGERGRWKRRRGKADGGHILIRFPVLAQCHVECTGGKFLAGKGKPPSPSKNCAGKFTKGIYVGVRSFGNARVGVQFFLYTRYSAG